MYYKGLRSLLDYRLVVVCVDTDKAKWQQNSFEYVGTCELAQWSRGKMADIADDIIQMYFFIEWKL